MREAAIVTHGDVDGMTCAAQLLRREDSHCELHYSNPRWIADKLAGLLKRDTPPDRIYVTDIPVNVRAAEVVERLAGVGVQVYWIDHHPWADGLLKRMRLACAHVEYNEALHTPAGALLARWLEAEDPYYARVGRICYASEKGTQWERDWFRLLASYTAHCDRDVLERLAYDHELTEEDVSRIDEQVACEQLAEQILAQEPRVVDTASGRPMAVYDTSDRPGVFIGGKPFRHHSVDFCLVRISTRKWQIACRPKSELTLQPLVGRHELGDFTVKVAGRPNRLLSMEARTSAIPPDAHRRVVAWAGKLL